MRSKMTGKIIAITGTVGKSTTKEMIAHLLRGDNVVATNPGNHNTRTWVDLIVANCTNNPDICVLEVSLDPLWQRSGSVCKWLRPHLSVITHIGAGHTEICGTIERVAFYKTKICDGIQDGGNVLLNRHMGQFDYVRKRVTDYGATPLVYGTEPDCDALIRKTERRDNRLHIWANILGEEVEYSLGQIGLPNALNSIAALAAAKTLGFDAASLICRMESYKANDSILDLFEAQTRTGKVTILDDSDNSQTLSILSAIDTFKDEANRIGGEGRRVVILCETLFLGRTAATAYASLAEPLIAAKVDMLFAGSPVLQPLLEKLPPAMVGGVYTDASSCVNAALQYIKDGDCILLKSGRDKDFHKVRDLLVTGLLPHLPSCAAWRLDDDNIFFQSNMELVVAEGLGGVMLLYLTLTALHNKRVHLADSVEVGEYALTEKNRPNALGLSNKDTVPFGTLLAAMITSNAPDAMLALAGHLSKKVYGKPILRSYADIAATIALDAPAFQNATGRKHSTKAQRFTLEELHKIARLIFSQPVDLLKPLKTTFIAHNGRALETNSVLHSLSNLMYYYCFGDQVHNAIAYATVKDEKICLCVCGAQSIADRDNAIASMLFKIKNDACC